MPDSNDLDRPNRGHGGRPTGGAGGPPVDDPLAELAKIVSGRSSDDERPPRDEPRPAEPPAKSAAPDTDILGDLEAELLSNLQASFSAVQDSVQESEPVPGTAGHPTPPATTPATGNDPDPRPSPPRAGPEPVASPPTTEGRPTEPPHSAPRPRRPAQHWPPPADGITEDWADDVLASRRPKTDQPGQPPADTSAPDGYSRPQAQTDQDLGAADGQQVEQPTKPAADRPALIGKRVDIGRLALRRSAAAGGASAPSDPSNKSAARPAGSRWEKPAASQSASDISRFAPPSAARATATPAAERPQAQQAGPRRGDPGDGEAASLQAAADQTEPHLDELDLSQDDEDFLPPFETDDLDGLIGRRRPGIGMMATVGALALVIIVGGLSLILFRSGGQSGEPPVIAADASPTKILPPEVETANADGANKLIYDRVDSAGRDQSPIVLQPGAEPLADAGRSLDDNPIARIILPGGPDVQPANPLAGGLDPLSDLAATAMEIVDPVGPRRVRTVVVRPDGTIVSSEATTEAAAAGGQPVPNLPTPLPEAPSIQDDTITIAGTDTLGAGNELIIEPLPEASPDGIAPFQVGAQPAPATAPTPRPAPPAPRTPAEVASADTSALNLAPGGGSTASPIQNVVGGGQPSPAAAGMLVQISSQRSQEAARATFRDLQSRYPTILGGYELDIQRADLGDRGIFFRVRVGPFQPGDAQRLCDDLKAAGGDCILSRS